ncbi:Predicted acetyltransferase [Andreprevotia lacus DSM 23236]|jgi:predicted acetyltransferase|uniref:Predicted acetyltransferase n=1 Tax=Andreprevotia lacus DSM 23236 TaxID=1121001 RepID=A0A1W1WXE1_9NEIS|nr:GNAT family N-acetyltransferase [Andreprevotia lacus]SMC16250.1 Predicted acetyltransferase [Andreprevotia lacus DSM 23236]
MELIPPNRAYQASYRAYIAELGDEVRYPFTMDLPHDDFDSLLHRLAEIEQGIALLPGHVSSSTYWLVDDGELIGVSNLRHVLNERIRHIGGHVGLGIRPSRRGQGLGTRLLAQTLVAAGARGLRDIHVHCYADNHPSARMIVANGGVLDSTVQLEDRVVERYRIAS